MVLQNLPSQSWDTNANWMVAANLAADLDAWLCLLALHDSGDVAEAESGTVLYRPPARPVMPDAVTYASTRPDPGPTPSLQLAAPHRPAPRHLTDGPGTRRQGTPHPPGDVKPWRTPQRQATAPTSYHKEQTGANRPPRFAAITTEERGRLLHFSVASLGARRSCRNFVRPWRGSDVSCLGDHDGLPGLTRRKGRLPGRPPPTRRGALQQAAPRCTSGASRRPASEPVNDRSRDEIRPLHAKQVGAEAKESPLGEQLKNSHPEENPMRNRNGIGRSTFAAWTH